MSHSGSGSRGVTVLALAAVIAAGCDTPKAKSGDARADGGSATDASPPLPRDGGGPAEFVPLIETGFERNEAVGCEGTDPDLRCGDASLAHDALLFYAPQPNEDWTTWPRDELRFGLAVYYEAAATPDDRHARLVDDPTSPGNLRLWMQRATIEAGFDGHFKGRVQTNTTFDPRPTELFVQQRVYFHPDLGLLLSYPPDGDDWWLSIIFQEMRAGSPSMGDAQSFRMVLSLIPDFAAGVFRLAAEGDKNVGGAWEGVWDAGDAATAIPLGEWLTFELAYRQGDATTGRFAVVVWADDRTSPLLTLDVSGWTYSPDASAPVALTSWGGPQKLYTSDNVIDHIRTQSGVAQIYFDDFRALDAWPPGWAPPGP